METHVDGEVVQLVCPVCVHVRAVVQKEDLDSVKALAFGFVMGSQSTSELAPDHAVYSLTAVMLLRMQSCARG